MKKLPVLQIKYLKKGLRENALGNFIDGRPTAQWKKTW
jgi:hypothetical protein